MLVVIKLFRSLCSLLFNSCYDSSYSSSELLSDIYHDTLYNSSNPTFEYDFPPNPVFELYDSSYDSSDLFLGDLDEAQIENETINIVVSPENNTILRRDEDQEGYNDDNNECEGEEREERNLNEYAKQQGFCFCKKRRVPDLLDNTITRRRTYECSHVQIHEAQKVILVENRRDRDSEMIGCPWHINISFPKSANNIRVNSIVGEHNHDMNLVVNCI